MKLNKYLKLFFICLMMVLFATLVLGALTYSTRSPGDLTSQKSTTVVFNWMPNLTGTQSIIPSYLYVTNTSNETQFLLNQTIKHCQDEVFCNVTVSGFLPGFYQWRIVSGDLATQANLTGNESFPFNTTLNNNLTFLYTNNGTAERCSVALASNDFANSTDIVNDISSACENVTASTSTNTSTVSIVGPDWGTDASITLLDGNASTLLGFFSNASGTQTNVTSSAFYFGIIGTSGDSFDNLTFSRWLNGSGYKAMQLNKDTAHLTVFGNLSVDNMRWTNLSDYPAACPSGSAVTTLGDSVTCTSYSVVSNFNSSNYGTAGLAGVNKSLLVADFGGSVNCFVNFTNGLFTGSNCTTT